MNVMMNKAIAFLSLSCAFACVEQADDPTEQLETLETLDQALKNGGVYTSVPSGFLAVGGVNGCSATIITEFAALTSADCVTNNTSAMFIAGNGRGTITGTALHHPLRNVTTGEYNVALIRFPASIYNTPGLNAVGLEPLRVLEGSYSPTNVILGYGARGSSCQTPADGKLSYGLVYPTSLDIDRFIDIISDDPGEPSACDGDLGGPLLTYKGSALGWQVAGVMGSNNSNHTSTKTHPLMTSSEWIRRNSARPDIDNNTRLSANCVIFDGTSPTANGLRANVTNSSNLGFWNNRTSAVWVKDGYKLEMYDSFNHIDHMGDLHGYDGEDCNEQGCWHDLTGTSNDNDISSLKCTSILPTYSPHTCILYDRPGHESYAFSNHQNLPTNYGNLSSEIEK